MCKVHKVKVTLAKRCRVLKWWLCYNYAYGFWPWWVVRTALRNFKAHWFVYRYWPALGGPYGKPTGGFWCAVHRAITTTISMWPNMGS